MIVWISKPKHFKWIEEIVEKIDKPNCWRAYHKLLNLSEKLSIKFVHVNNTDIWNADVTMSSVILPVLEKFKENLNSFPNIHEEDIKDEWKGLTEFEIWKKILEDMIYAFKINKSFETKNVDHERVKNGHQLFGKYYTALWD